MAETFNRGTGRRKNAVARVRIQPGEGRITVNEKDLLAFLGRRVLELAANAPLRVTSTQRKFDVSVKVAGGGTSGQAGAHAVPGISIPSSYETPVRKSGKVR